MRMPRRSVRLYLFFHIGLLAALCAFPLYRALTSILPTVFTRCVLHDRLFLYCPLCGGTRALEALLQGDLSLAFAYNPYVIALGLAAVALDAVALVRLLRKKEPLLPYLRYAWVVFLVSAVLFAVLRNYMMISGGYDPIGDLGSFWNR